ncbi:AraC family transcriptional regulator [Bradyrhizobium sp. 1]|uniref:AraC family transcriptional regulator n=1 Tax=Bradyrhizobium sp. 1 TaxID=241591 RepID=UPI001FFA977D|nr:AraC family transcriptional regulator [Bradyrhizobium sp. 1]MCK1390931.1 helix-turn-helix transcriptional regulator [Bradyrhizobium sp. 1]
MASAQAMQGPAKNVPPEHAFSLHVPLLPVAVDLWIDGRHHLTKQVNPGDTFLFDLRSNPVSEIHAPFDIIRFYISQASLDELAFDQGISRTKGLISPGQGVYDRVMYGLANALLDQVERADERSTLFIDHVALAFYAHVMRAYGNATLPDAPVSGGLSPWQLRRVIDFISAHLDGDPTIAELARECALSPGYFARAFRRTTGITPHQWLVRKRVERAKALLLAGTLGLAEIAFMCGFVDQSHFTRVFTKLEGDSPGRWRQTHR